MDVAGDDGDNLFRGTDHFLDPLDPFFARQGAHPFDPGIDRRMVHDDHRRDILFLAQAGLEPFRPRLAHHAAVTAGIECIDDDKPQAAMLGLILDEAILIDRDFGQHFAKPIAAVVIADRPQHRTLPAFDQ